MPVSKPKKGYKLVETEFGKYEEISEDWEYTELKDKINILSGFSFKSEFFDKEIGLPLIRIRDLPNKSTKIRYNGEYSKDFLINSGDLLVGMDGEFKPYIWKGEKSLLNQRVCKIKTKDNKKLEQRFLYYSIKKGLSYYEQVNTGTTVGHLSKFDIEEIKIGLPKNIFEQQKIASILSNVDNILEKTNQILEQTEYLRKGLKQKLFTKGIGHTKFKKVKWYYDKEIEIPEKSECIKFGDFITDIKYGTSTKSNNQDKGLPILGIPNILGGEIQDKNVSFVDLSYKEKEKFLLKEDDILFVRTNGNPNYLGRSALFKEKTRQFVYASYLIRIRVNTNKIFPEYLQEFLQSWLIHMQVLSLARTSAGNYNINTKEIRSLLIIKHDTTEQQKITSILSNVNSQIQKEKLQKSNLELLKKGLMPKLLTGQIRVKV